MRFHAEPFPSGPGISFLRKLARLFSLTHFPYGVHKCHSKVHSPDVADSSMPETLMTIHNSEYAGGLFLSNLGSLESENGHEWKVYGKRTRWGGY